MTKKLPLLAPLILTLTISTLAATVPKPASAAVWYDNTTWWSVAEMLDFYQEVEQEKADLCGSDTACIEEFNMIMIEKGQKYSALENFLQGQFWVTAINPKEETVKILYFDQEMMLRHTGIEEKLTLKSFYLAWFDEWHGQIYNFYRPQFVSGEIEGLHTVYDSIAEGLNTAHLPAWREIELSVPGTDLLSNTSGKLDLAVFGTNGFNSMGYTDYSDCLNAPDYEEGMECKLMISGDKWISYFPPRAEIVEPDPEPVTDPAPATISTPELIDVESTLPDELGKGAANENPVATTSIIEPAKTSNKTPKSPNTGAETYPGAAYSREIDMPWWVMALIMVGITLLIWWFAPNHSKLHKTTKISKNLRKKY